MRPETSNARWLAERIEQATALGIASSVAQMIRDGDAVPGDRLPHVRELAHELRISPSTVSAAWLLLRQRGLVAGRGRGGTRVANAAAEFSELHIAPDIVSQWDLRFVYPDGSLLPSLGDSLQQAARLPNLDEYYQEGILPQLRDAVLPTWPCAAETFVAVNGIFDGAWSALRSISVPGDRIAIETPTVPPLIRIVKDLGLIPVEVATDCEGPMPGALAEALKSRPVAFVYQPRAHVPTGSVVSEQRVHDLAALLRCGRTAILEVDDLNSLSTATARSLGSLIPDRTVLLRSYEKAYGPDLRLAVMGGPVSVLESVHGRTLLSHRWVSRILQSSLAWLIEDKATQDSQRAAARTYADRRTRLAEALRAQGISTSAVDGLCLWVPVADETAAVRFLATHGVLVHAGSHSYPRTGAPHIRVATSRLCSSQDSIARLIAAAGAYH
ncbi:aminotransferase class I/II-fold pyridoxal phosphate-dependent enzyme [Streptomyces puniciscabiei]